jgi:hypothetical protein
MMNQQTRKPGKRPQIFPAQASLATRGLPPGVTTVFLVLVVVLTGYPFFFPGHPTGDMWPHLSRMKLVYDAIRQGSSPFYSFMFYSGYPDLRFYSPLSAFLGGFLALFTGGNLLLAVRLLLFLLHALSAWFMFGYLSYRTRNHSAAILGTAVYLLIPWRVFSLVFLNNHPHALLYALLPLACWALERLNDNRRAADALLLGLWCALLIVSHVVYASVTFPFLLILLLFGHSRRRVWPAVALAIGAALLLSAFFLIPFLAEFTTHRALQPVRNLSLPPTFADMLGLKNLGGMSVDILLFAAVCAVVISNRTTFRRYAPILVGLLLSYLLLFSPKLLGARQTLVTFGLPSERYLAYVVFFASTLGASALPIIRSKFGRRSWIPAAVFCIFSLLLVYNFVQYLPSRRQIPSKEALMPEEIEAVYRTVATENPTKCLQTGRPKPSIDDFERICVLPAMGFVYHDLPTPLGPPYHQFAPSSMRYVYPWVDYLAADLGNPKETLLTRNSFKTLRLLGVSHVVTFPAVVSQGEGAAASWMLKAGINWDTHFIMPASNNRPPILWRTGADLALAGNTLRPWGGESTVQRGALLIADDAQRLLDSTEIDTAANRINFIPVRSPESETLSGIPSLRILSHRVRNQDVLLEVSVNCECFLRLSLSYYSELQVLLDDKPTAFSETRDHFIYLRCPFGTHRVRVIAPLTPLRRVTFLVSGIAVILFAGLLVAFARRDTNEGRRRGTSPTS